MSKITANLLSYVQRYSQSNVKLILISVSINCNVVNLTEHWTHCSILLNIHKLQSCIFFAKCDVGSRKCSENDCHNASYTACSCGFGAGNTSAFTKIIQWIARKTSTLLFTLINNALAVLVTNRLKNFCHQGLRKCKPCNF